MKNVMQRRKAKIDEVVEEIQRRIAEGIYQAGDQLPAERDLADELQVSRQTLRTALLRLQANSQIETRPRDGIFIRASHARVVIGPASRKTRAASLLTSVVLMQHQEGSRRILEPEATVPADQELAQKLEIEVGTAVFRTRLVYCLNQVPYRIVESYSVATFLQQMEAELSVSGEPTPEARPCFLSHAFERFLCRLPQEREAELLRMNRHQPVIDLERWTWLHDDTLGNYTHVVANALLHEYTYAYDGDNQQALILKIVAGS